MLLDGKIWVGTSGAGPVCLLPAMANRHGLISGATGTGKTVTLQVLAEGFSRLGVPVFLADVKGDLAGLSMAGEENPKIMERLAACGVSDFSFAGCPVTFWDVFGEMGHPVRTTVSEMGPLLLSRMLGLNDTQAGVMHLVFRIADDAGMLLTDLKDIRAMLAFVGEDPGRYTLDYGHITKSSLGAIQRALAILEDEGGDVFFGEPALDLNDWFRQDARHSGVVNILHAEKLFRRPVLYSTFMLWLLGALYAALPEQGDTALPRMVFFFDEAHLLFDDCPKTLLDRIGQTVRLIRSKGVGVYFITQTPTDIPSAVLSQLSSRVQHALRAYTPAEKKVVRAVAQTFRENPDFDTEEALTNLKTGEALLSFLQADGAPSVTQRATILPPQSHIGAIVDAARRERMEMDAVGAKYDAFFDRESAYEMLSARMSQAGVAAPALSPQDASSPGSAEYVPIQVFNPETNQYEMRPVPTLPTALTRPAAPSLPARQEEKTPAAPQAAEKPKKAPARKRSEMTYGEQLLDKALQSASASAGRQIGAALSRSILDVLGLNKRKR